CPPACLSACLSVCLPACLSVCLPACLVVTTNHVHSHIVVVLLLMQLPFEALSPTLVFVHTFWKDQSRHLVASSS
uniref:Uncharacterized protein n=1 Tax=Takifugu rubripes TaxID=31033 RepID=A0A674MF09_TAKRU